VWLKDSGGRRSDEQVELTSKRTKGAFCVQRRKNRKRKKDNREFAHVRRGLGLAKRIG